jgi:RHS repeat-associated protein
MKGTSLKSIRPTLLALLATFTLVTQARAVGYWGRMYDPNLQRWIQRDPIGEQGDINLYRFVGNSPANRTDAWGLNSYVVNAGGYTGHTSFVVDNPGGGVIAYHFFAAHHGGNAPWYMQDMGLFYDGVHIWSQYANSLEDYMANEGKLYGDLNVWGVGIGTPEDDARAIARINQEMQDQEGYYSLLGGSECHHKSWDWFHDYTWAGRDVPTSEMHGIHPLFLNGQAIFPPSFFKITPAFSLGELPSFGPMN